ncbi:chorismate-binding protein, partial [Bacteroides sp. OttesenSCG-928-J23]|nr:chorismate-binding protein [Bacteroides sp. OttesenSCG-928-J23]
QYIIEQLETFSVNTSERGPYTVRAAELAHLKSDFSFTLPHCDCLGELLELLHPTPAVCGFPKEKAYRFILENEGYTRSYYSGFVGMLNAERRSNLYVNLRCMQIMNDKLYLYAGGGLLSSSEMEEEWQEIEDKLYTMRAII